MTHYEPRQQLALLFGEGCCYLQCIVRVCEERCNTYIDSLATFFRALRVGLVQENGLVLAPERIAQLLTGDDWFYHKEGKEYQPRPDERSIERWERPTPKVIYSHFVYRPRVGELYDPLGDSETLRPGNGGYLVSKRILRLLPK